PEAPEAQGQAGEGPAETVLRYPAESSATRCGRPQGGQALMPKLTKLERDMLVKAGTFVLAGEWPWETGDLSPATLRREVLEKGALKSAVRKLNMPLAPK